jgi:methyltransferase (TIGR00027 family)
MDERTFVQLTGLATAYLRAAESARPDRLINDPFAEKLAGDVASQFMSFVSKWGPSSESAMDMLAIRTRYLDEALIHRNQDISQIVILAAGMDSRAYRLEALKGCHVLEVDQSQEYMDQKKRTLQEMAAEPIAKKVDCIVADLANDAWQTQLVASGFNPKQPTFWCLEGLLYYLDRSSIVNVLETMDALSATDSQFWVDMCGKSTLESDQFGVQGLKFGEDNPKEGILSRIHWDLDIVASFDQPGAHFGREWEPLKLSENSNDVLQWFFLLGKKPPNPDVTPLL